MDENPGTEVTPIQDGPIDQTDLELSDTGTEQPVQNQIDYTEQLQQVIDALHKQDELHTIVGLPNGSQFDLVAEVTVGEALVSAAIFLLLSFQVIRWLLDHVWRR